ncbi:shufflon protein C, partial [Salmonella sp. C3260]
VTIWLSPAPIFFHVPDWHWPPCQSGIWTTAKVNFTTSTYNIGKNTRNLSIGVHAYCSWTYLNGAPFGGFQQVYSDQNKVWYVNNYAWGNYESGGTITVTCLNLPGAGI